MPPLDAPHTDLAAISALVEDVRRFFDTGGTRPIAWRRKQLERLLALVTERETELCEAVAADFGKPRFEAWATETGFVASDVKHTLAKLARWMRPERAPTNLTAMPGSSRIVREPLGCVLIIAPWNYPIQLVLSPLAAALAAGNCAVLKPSELTPHVSAVLAKLVPEYLDRQAVRVVGGAVDETTALLRERWDHIFFTGGGTVGRVVMEAAAKHLTPVTLELGGKSPCIVDDDVDMETAARRIVWGKFLNAGQTCIAPDYLLVNRQIKPALLAAMQQAIHEFYGEDPAQSPDYGRIVNDRHFGRLSQLLQDGQLVTGGIVDPAQRYIAPTILDQVGLDTAVMQDEIFGPILPVLDYGDIGEAIALIKARPKPLALYLFTRNAALQESVLTQTSSGGVCINDTVMQIAPSSLPFGGVGQSGMGSYHGKASFDGFSHYKSIMVKNFWFDINWRYAPYAGKLELFKKIIR